MNPFWNVVLACILASTAMAIAGLKLLRPASPWHRRVGYFVAIGSFFLALAMVIRWLEYQRPLTWWSRLHVLFGVTCFFAFVAKVCSSRRWFLSPGFLRPLGYVLTVAFPLAAFGMGHPFLVQALSWTKLTVSEVTRNPKQESFDTSCCVCHDRQKAVGKLGVRTEQRWIDITEPMAWAGSLDRETLRGALAALLAPPSAALEALPRDPIDRTCLSCHTKTRIVQAKKNPSEWRETVLRMQEHARRNPSSRQISDDDVKALLGFLQKGFSSQ